MIVVGQQCLGFADTIGGGAGDMGLPLSGAQVQHRRGGFRRDIDFQRRWHLLKIKIDLIGLIGRYRR